jgi:hypothetical protein
MKKLRSKYENILIYRYKNIIVIIIIKYKYITFYFINNI